MYWDDNLGKLAEKWARQCNFQHDLSANRELKKNEPIAQNMFRIFHGGPDLLRKKEMIQAGIESWFQGYRDLTIDKISSYVPIMNAENFVNMIWASSDRVK